MGFNTEQYFVTWISDVDILWVESNYLTFSKLSSRMGYKWKDDNFNIIFLYGWLLASLQYLLLTYGYKVDCHTYVLFYQICGICGPHCRKISLQCNAPYQPWTLMRSTNSTVTRFNIFSTRTICLFATIESILAVFLPYLLCEFNSQLQLKALLNLRTCILWVSRSY